MRILFVIFDEISVRGAGARSAAALGALADAGHQIDVISARVALPEHPNIRVLQGRSKSTVGKRRLRSALGKAARKGKYDAVHVVDHAVVSVCRVLGLRKTPILYDASRCFTGVFGSAPSSVWRWFPRMHGRQERRMLVRARVVLSPCATLEADLKKIAPEANVTRLDHAPVPAARSVSDFDRTQLEKRLGSPCSVVIACGIPLEGEKELRAPIMAARKVLDTIPGAAFVFMDAPKEKAEKLAANLDIGPRCVFFDRSESRDFISTLAFADAALFMPPKGCRYVRPELFSFLASPAPLVVAREGGPEGPLNDENRVAALTDVDSIADALRRVIQEPLFSIGVATNGQRLVAERYSLSSFKHKLRMIYHEVFRGE